MDQEINNFVRYDELLSSSSSSDDDLEFEYNYVFDNVNCRCNYRISIPRVQNYIEIVIDAYNEIDFRNAFR